MWVVALYNKKKKQIQKLYFCLKNEENNRYISLYGENIWGETFQ